MTKSEALAKLHEQRDWQCSTFDDDAVEFTNELISMLTNATIWTPCSDRMPTEGDADAQGFVGTQWPDGVPSVDSWECVASGNHDYYAWSRIEPKGGGNG